MSNLTTNVDPHEATITVRIIRSFEYRTIKNHVLRNIDLTSWTTSQLIETVRELVLSKPGLRPYRTVEFNAAKVYSHAHLTKSQNLSINLDHDDDPNWVLSRPENSGKTLHELGVMNETEISIYNDQAYEQFKANPVQKWE